MWIVEQMIGNDWENVWQTDGEPSVFASEEEAQAEIDDFLADQAEAVADGFMEDTYEREDFRVVEVANA